MSFLSPFLLAGLLGLPLLVWLLRATPPQPVRQVFGGMFFLKRLSTPKQQPVRTPLLVLIIRCLAFALIIIGLAGPKLGPQTDRLGGDLTVVLGNGWDAAQRWDERLEAARAAIDTAGGNVRILTTTDGVLSPPYSRIAAERALTRITPQPTLADWEAVGAALEDNEARVALIPGGLAPLAEVEMRLTPPLSAYVPEGPTFVLGDPVVSGDAITVRVFRSLSSGTDSRTVRAMSSDGRTISTVDVRFAPGEQIQEAVFRLPLSLRNAVSRLDIEGLRSTGAVSLLGSSARRTLAGIVSNGSETLREGGFYITRALEPVAEVIEAPIAELVALEPGLIILDDVGTFRPTDRVALTDFLENGGVLLRFAGPAMLGAEIIRDDPLLPAPLLGGERALGGALTWAEPQRVDQIDQESPLAGLVVSEEIAVRRQVLSQPGTSAEVWARLADGTPLITAAQRGSGLLVMIHVNAAPTWSDLPISGLYVRMMQRIATLAETDLAADLSSADEALPANRVLSGRGALEEPAADSPALAQGAPLPPPGLYGQGASEIAVNAYTLDEAPRAFVPADLPRGSRVLTVNEGSRRDFSVWFVTAALLLLALDGVISMGRFVIPRGATAALLLLFLAPLAIEPASAQLRPPLPSKAEDAALAIRFAYVETGDRSLDRISAAGLFGLTQAATRRSSLEPAAPQGVNLDRDELSVYALLYWPLRPGHAEPSDAALQRLEEFMNLGGMLIIDTGDGGAPGQSLSLRDVLGRLDAPPLEPLPDDHVLLFSFYRLDNLWGRNPNGQVWVETRGALDQRRDSVPSLIIAGRDWASAWAVDEQGIPLRPAGPGGESRREMAFRAGINMAMVAITGNYKADQAEVGALLDSLGRTAQ